MESGLLNGGQNRLVDLVVPHDRKDDGRHFLGDMAKDVSYHGTEHAPLRLTLRFYRESAGRHPGRTLSRFSATETYMGSQGAFCVLRPEGLPPAAESPAFG